VDAAAKLLELPYAHDTLGHREDLSVTGLCLLCAEVVGLRSGVAWK